MKNITYRVAAVYLLACFVVLVNLFAGNSLFSYSLYLLFTMPIAAAVVLLSAPTAPSRAMRIASRAFGILLFLGSVGVSAPFVFPMVCYVFHGLHNASGCSSLFITYSVLLIPSILVLLLGIFGFFFVHWQAWLSHASNPAYRARINQLMVAVVCVMVVAMMANFVRNIQQVSPPTQQQ